MRELSCTKHPFGAYDVHPEALGLEQDFAKSLAYSLELWCGEGCKVVLLEVPIRRAELIPVAVAAGFKFHFSAPDYLTLVLNLVKEAPLVPKPVHFAAVGGVVQKDDKVLLVKNRGRTHYHFPGGFADPGEHLAQAVRREVLEETGVSAEPVSLLYIRHLHDNSFRKPEFSDLYFVFRLDARSTQVRLQMSELIDGGWWKLTEALASDKVGDVSKHVLRLAQTKKGLRPGWLKDYGVDESGLETFSAAD